VRYGYVSCVSTVQFASETPGYCVVKRKYRIKMLEIAAVMLEEPQQLKCSCPFSKIFI